MSIVHLPKNKFVKYFFDDVTILGVVKKYYFGRGQKIRTPPLKKKKKKKVFIFGRFGIK